MANVNNRMKTTRRFELEEKEIAILWLDVFLFNFKTLLLVGALYGTCSSNVGVHIRIEKNIENVYLQNHETILMGNLNYFNKAYNSHRLAKALKTISCCPSSLFNKC